jgi:hypothetical protein
MSETKKYYRTVNINITYNSKNIKKLDNNTIYYITSIKYIGNDESKDKNINIETSNKSEMINLLNDGYEITINKWMEDITEFRRAYSKTYYQKKKMIKTKTS